MNIININSKYNLTPWQIAFTKLVLNCEEYNFSNNYLCNLLETIPFYLVNESTFCLIKDGSYHKSKKKENDDEIEKRISTTSNSLDNNTFSYYIRKGLHDIPEIYLCPEAILKFTKNEDEVIILLAKVIIYKLAYAFINKEELEPKDEFYYWMKEACPIEMTLNYFDIFGEMYYNSNKFYLNHQKNVVEFEHTIEFCSTKTEIYKLGFYLFENRFFSYLYWNDYEFTKSDKKIDKEKWLHYLKSEVLNNELSENDKEKDTFKDITRKIIMNDDLFNMHKKMKSKNVNFIFYDEKLINY